MSVKIRAVVATGFAFVLMALGAQASSAQTGVSTIDSTPLSTVVTSQNLGQVMDYSKTRSLVMLFSNCNCGDPNCPICNPKKKALEDLVQRDNGRWALATVDLAANPELAEKFQITDATALAVVKNLEVTAKEAAPEADAIAAWVHQKIA